MATGIRTVNGKGAAQEPVQADQARPGAARGPRRSPHRRHRRAPRCLIWRRLLEEEVCRLEHELLRAKASAPPGLSAAQLKQRRAVEGNVACELKRARTSIRKRSEHGFGRLRDAWFALVSVWTGSEMETGWAALHRGERDLLLIAPSDYVLAEYGRMRAVIEQTAPSVMRDPRYTAVLERFKEPGGRVPRPAPGARRQGPAGTPTDADLSQGDRAALAELRRRLDDDWELARAQIRIFRNVLTVMILVLTGLLTVLCVWDSWHPGFLPLRGDTSGTEPKGGDVATVVLIGAFGGLLSSVAALRRLHDFERDYGLPLAQLILKVPMGGALALAGVLLLQHGAFGSIEPVKWESISTYALLFGIAQVALTRTIDNRATDLLESASATEPGGLAKAEASTSAASR